MVARVRGVTRFRIAMGFYWAYLHLITISCADTRKSQLWSRSIYNTLWIFNDKELC